jgi:imidazoleglycerol-phosphate dehydratase
MWSSASSRPKIGDVAAENLGHFFQSFAIAGRMALHVDVLKGQNDHHRAEAAFKAAALALKDAVAMTAHGDIPSTKGLL